LPDSKYLRGRFSFHYLHNILQMDELIVDHVVTDQDELDVAIDAYVDKVYEIEAKQMKLRDKIIRRKHKLFEENNGEREWLTFLNRLRRLKIRNSKNN
tara:strand:- start:11 stop:304 length:294 start_codon:yes stop_codon:yes gene_type:complete